MNMLSGGNFRSIPFNCMIRHVYYNRAELSFLQQKTAFWCSFKRITNWRLVCPIYLESQSLHGIQQIASIRCTFMTGSRFNKRSQASCPIVKIIVFSITEVIKMLLKMWYPASQRIPTICQVITSINNGRSNQGKSLELQDSLVDITPCERHCILMILNSKRIIPIIWHK